MSHMEDAKELMREFPEQTKGYTWYEVMKMWEEYSETMEAGWLIPDEQSVNYVFS